MKPGSLAATPDRVNGRLLGWASLGLSRLFQNFLPLRVIPLLFFALLGVGLYQQALRPPFPPQYIAHLPQNEEVVLSGRLCRPSRVGPEWVRLYVAVEAWKSPEGWRPATGTLLITAPPLTAPPVGTPLTVRGKLREPQALHNPGAMNRPRQLAVESVFRQLRLADPGHLVFLAAAQGPSLAERLRGGIRGLLEGMPPDIEAIYRAMLLGDQGKVTPEMRRNLSLTGTSHLLAISGLHLGALAGLTYFLVFWLLRRFPWVLVRLNAMKAAALIAALPVVAYAHLAGGSPATQRAEIMVLAYLLLVLLGRPRDVWSALVLAALVILLVNPLLLFSVSFQLSFAAVGGLIYFLPRWFEAGTDSSASKDRRPGWRRRVGKRLAEALAVSAVASLVTAPLVAHYFQVVSLFGFLVNLAAIPLVLMLALPLGGLAVLAELLSLTPLAAFFLHIGEIPLRMGYALIAWVAGLPGSGVTVPSPGWLQVGLIYALLFLLLPRRRSRLTWAGAGLAAALLAVTITFPLARPPQAGEITVLDSTTGLDAVLVAPEGRGRAAVTAAWDIWPGWEGGGLGALPSYLHWRQFRRLDALLALNLNARNAPEMLTLARQFDLGGVWWEGRRPEGNVVELINLLGDRGRPGVSLTRMNPPTRLGGLTLDYLSLAEGRGVALRVTCQRRQVLILPPLKQAVLESLPADLADGPLDALIAPREVVATLAVRWSPEVVIGYGSRKQEIGKHGLSLPAVYLTRDGAVTLTLSEAGAACEQWLP